MSYTTLISVDKLRGLIDTGAVTLLDCRFDLANAHSGRDAYLQAHVPSAVYVDLNSDLARPMGASSGRHPLPERQDFAATLRRLGVDHAKQVVAYDEANGAFAARAWWMLRWMGHAKTAVLNGGMRAWAAAGGALESGEQHRHHAANHFIAHDPMVTWLTTHEVEAALQDPARQLIDARAPERYTGAAEPIDPVAGHVPGAINLPMSGNLHADGRFLAPDDLRRRFLASLGNTPPAQIISMCGSGVTACHNLLALEVAGLGGGALYAGSWSEWIRDPTRPIATGA
jgi:thiosulfate/3-mercaptopyruvate sulfurtransferase